MDMPNIEVIRHWVAWGPSAECPDGYMEHSTERVEQFQAWLAEVKANVWDEGHERPWEIDVDGHKFTAVNPYRGEKK